MAHQELIEATNQLFRLGGDASPDETAKALALACRALGSTLEDAMMARQLDGLAASKPYVDSSDASQLAEFCRTFLRTERELLHSAGLSDGAVRSLVEAGEELLANCVSTPLNVGQLFASVHLLESRICGRARQIKKTALERRSHMDSGRTVKRSAIGVGGVAIIAINAGVVVAIPAVPAPYALVSTSLGTALVRSALGKPWSNKTS
jgi:hypothetical protein